MTKDEEISDLKTEILNLQANNDDFEERIKSFEKHIANKNVLLSVGKINRGLDKKEIELFEALFFVKDNLERISKETELFKAHQKRTINKILRGYYERLPKVKKGNSTA